MFLVIASESQPTSSVTFSMLSEENKVLDSKNKIVGEPAARASDSFVCIEVDSQEVARLYAQTEP